MLETNVRGDVKLGFMVSKGQLEIDVVVVKGLMKSGLTTPPGIYHHLFYRSVSQIYYKLLLYKQYEPYNI